MRLQELTPELAFHFRVSPRSGVLIAGIDEGSPAQDAGLERGRIIARANGRAIPTIADFERATRGLAAGDTLPLDILSDDGAAEKIILRVATIPRDRLEAFLWWSLGVTLKEGSSEPVPGPVISGVRPNSPAAGIGLSAGDKIAAVGGRDCDDLTTFHRHFAALRNSRNILLSVVRGRTLYRISVPLQLDSKR